MAKRGIAVVRYEKRTKAYGAACVPAGRELDYDTEAVDDAVAIVEQVRALPELAPDSVYVLGHSLGGTLAPRIAGRSKGLAGIIILAGLARSLEDALEEQFYYTSSLTDSSVNVKVQLDELKQQLANVKKLGTEEFDETISLPLGQPRSYWLFANAYKPVEVAAKLKLPIFVLQGVERLSGDYGRLRFMAFRFVALQECIFQILSEIESLVAGRQRQGDSV